MEDNSGSNFKIKWVWSARLIWDYELDYYLNCTPLGPVTNRVYDKFWNLLWQLNIVEFLPERTMVVSPQLRVVSPQLKSRFAPTQSRFAPTQSRFAPRRFAPNSKSFLPNLKSFRPIQNKTSTRQLMCDVLWNHKSVNVRKIQINMIPGGETVNHIVRV